MSLLLDRHLDQVADAVIEAVLLISGQEVRRSLAGQEGHQDGHDADEWPAIYCAHSWSIRHPGAGQPRQEHSVILTPFEVAVDGVQIPNRRYRYI